MNVRYIHVKGKRKRRRTEKKKKTRRKESGMEYYPKIVKRLLTQNSIHSSYDWIN